MDAFVQNSRMCLTVWVSTERPFMLLMEGCSPLTSENWNSTLFPVMCTYSNPLCQNRTRPRRHCWLNARLALAAHRCPSAPLFHISGEWWVVSGGWARLGSGRKSREAVSEVGGRVSAHERAQGHWPAYFPCISADPLRPMCDVTR